MNRTRRAILSGVLATLAFAVPVSGPVLAHAESPGGGSVDDNQPTEPGPWRWACTHPRVWVNQPAPLPRGAILYVDGGHMCAPEYVFEILQQGAGINPTPPIGS